MESKVYAYVRVSTREQNLDRQIQAMIEYGIPPAQIIREKQSGKDFDRPAYLRLLKKIKPGDTMVIKSIDRLGRNYDEILEQWRHITKVLRADVVVLDMPLLDTRAGRRDLTGTLIADLVLQLLSYVAQTEREFIHQRQKEGIAAAKARGVRFGRHQIQKPENYSCICALYQENRICSREAAKMLGVCQATFLKWIHESAEPNTDQFYISETEKGLTGVVK
ncbi:MAG: recombinase family protein [Oscillospiraceae bacterium]|nr:recombinase family protein [Oscillospiraceae bacterium]